MYVVHKISFYQLPGLLFCGCYTDNHTVAKSINKLFSLFPGKMSSEEYLHRTRLSSDLDNNILSSPRRSLGNGRPSLPLLGLPRPSPRSSLEYTYPWLPSPRSSSPRLPTPAAFPWRSSLRYSSSSYHRRYSVSTFICFSPATQV